MIEQALGGIGLFLIGMVLVTEELRAVAGDALRRFLLRFTGGTFSALLSGAAVTALVQSSSATTVATIGFVGAGLLTFEQALGLIFGANIGTTATGWIVAGLGLKFSVSTIALPLVGVGAFIKLFTRGPYGHVGLALSGFGIIFVGIDVLQAGMAGATGWLTPETLPGDSLAGRLALVGIGAVLTAIMQSSSAAITTALTALHGGAISLEQASAMVIGINVGTTITAGLAALGTSTAAKRTAFAHLLFNVVTGLVAFLSLPLFIWLVRRVGGRLGAGDATVLLATFHTAFNVLGVVLILPFARPFARMVTRAIRHRGPHLTRLLDPSAAGQGSVATEAVRQTAFEIAAAVLDALGPLAMGRKVTATQTDALDAAGAALRETEGYVGTLRLGLPLPEGAQTRYVSTIHALDHLGRLVELGVSAEPARGHGPELRSLHERLGQVLAAMQAWSADPVRVAPLDSAHQLAEDARQARRQLREDLLAQTAAGQVAPDVANARLERLRWLEEVTYHLYRLIDRLQGERLMLVPAEEPAPEAQPSEAAS